MRVEDFKRELDTLRRMFPVYCGDKHRGGYKKSYTVNYRGETFTFEITLCEECHNLFAYAVERLTEC
ncbi:MAG: hypothetical protein DSZ31_01090, partial [Gammaproteobacteria bacterium]